MLLGKKKKHSLFSSYFSGTVHTKQKKKKNKTQLGSGTKFGKIWMILVTDGHMDQI
jgi:hypothetical protein